VVGDTEERARDLIGRAGLVVEEVTYEASDEDPGTVLSTSPSATIQVQEGTSVDLVVSEGQELVGVPTLVGTSVDEATAALREAGLEVGQVEERDAPEDEGEVLEAGVQAGEQVPTGSAVDLVVSTGRTGVPDVTGQTEDDARAALEDAGFDVETTTRASAEAPEGTVLQQSPAAGTSQTPGTTITLTLAEAPAEPSPSPDEEPQDEATPGADPTDVPDEEPTDEPTDGATGAAGADAADATPAS
jgi:serine/threonine-protein kinase